jgi:hypothetical protein
MAVAKRSKFSVVRRTRQSKVSGLPLGAVRLGSDSADDEIVDAVTIEGLDHPGDVRSDGLR